MLHGQAKKGVFPVPATSRDDRCRGNPGWCDRRWISIDPVAAVQEQRQASHLIDLFETFVAHTDESTFLGPVHPTCLANSCVADAVLAYRRAARLVPGDGFARRQR